MKKEDNIIFLVYIFIGAAVTVLGITAVSYTHLDVYKRQP